MRGRLDAETGKKGNVEVRLSPERERFVRRLVERGQYPSAGSAIEAALRLLEARQGGRESVLQAVAVGLEQVITGHGGLVSSDEIKRRSRGKVVPR